jgi:isocitrate dehydrogenase kinase/phosphatase
VSGSPDRIVEISVSGFDRYCAEFAAITRPATMRFADRDWNGMQNDAAERLALYNATVASAVTLIREDPGAADRSAWAVAKLQFDAALGDDPFAPIGRTFFSSITRRVLETEGTDPDVEFTDDAEPATKVEPVLLLAKDGSTEEKLIKVVQGTVFEAAWQNLARDARLASIEIERRFSSHGETRDVDAVAVYPHPFYRGRAAYIVGTIQAGEVTLPLAIAVHHTYRGLTIGAILTEQDDMSVLFSYTRSSFLVEIDDPTAMVNFLNRLIPHRKPAELYSAIGFNKHGKTDRYRDLRAFIDGSDVRFEYARGIRGMVMIVFTLEGYDAVFKVIRDRFPYPKQTTRRQVMSKYRIVFGHDRAGRLIDAHEFEHMRFNRDRFTPELLAELQEAASRSVTVSDETVILHHVYLERKVVPLDIYLRESNPLKSRAAIIDYGRAIKNLAMSNIFPGDMLLKNFGVTRSGRVVFYDYDELTRVTECNFRELPQTADPDREMSAEPWFGVGERDVFPEEFQNFLGIRGELRDVLMRHHGDLFRVRFWRRVQERVRSGEVIEIFPYDRSRRLGSGVMRRTRRT